MLRISRKKRLTIVILAVAIVAAAVYLWFREVPLRVRASDIVLDPHAYDGKLVEVGGYLIKYNYGFWTGYGLYGEARKIALWGYERQSVDSGWVGPFDQYLGEWVVVIGRVEYYPGAIDAPDLYIKINKLSKAEFQL